MEKIVWTDEFSVGIKEIDEQHKKLVDLINTLIEADDLSVTSDIIAETLSELTQYVSYHFTTEERYMKEIDYPDFENHKQEHIKFKKQTVNFLLETMEMKDEVPLEILSFLKDWLVHHILETDMKYKPYFEEKGIH